MNSATLFTFQSGRGSSRVFTWLFSFLQMWRSITSPAAFSFPQFWPFPSCCQCKPCCKSHSNDLFRVSIKGNLSVTSKMVRLTALRRGAIEASWCVVQLFWFSKRSSKAIEASSCYCVVCCKFLLWLWFLISIWGSASPPRQGQLPILSRMVSLSLCEAIAPPPLCLQSGV